MGNYNDFDLNIKNIQTQKEDENLRFTSIYTCGDSIVVQLSRQKSKLFIMN